MNDPTPLLLETIKIEEGEISNLEYHQKRCDLSRASLFQTTDSFKLSSYIQPPSKGLYRCRIVYNKQIHSIEYIPYTPKDISTLKIVPSTIEYGFKYANRDAFNTLLKTYADVDEIIIEKDGYLSDTSIANIAFYDGEKWITPSSPLLLGTMRAKLIDEGFLHLNDIQKEDLSKYTQVALMNAMLGFKVYNLTSFDIGTKTLILGD
jgi:4-amino-4-deoxychorismate lyase